MNDAIPLDVADWALCVQMATILLGRTGEGHAVERLAGTVLLACLAPATGWVAPYVGDDLWQPVHRFWEAGPKTPDREERLYQEFSAVAQPLLMQEA